MASPFPQTFRVFCKASEDLSLTVRNGEVVLAPANPCDECQHWIKEVSYGAGVKDEKGFPSFALVNKATGQAVKHSFGHTHPVRLISFKQDYLDESILWTESEDIGEGFHRVTMLNNVDLHFDACAAVPHAHDGTPLILFKWNQGNNQRWKIAVHEKAPVKGPTQCPMRIFCRENQNLNLAVREGKAVLANANPKDETQQWIKDFSKTGKVTDEQGHHAFALVNKVTGKAIKVSKESVDELGLLVEVTPYNSNYVDVAMLWTEGADTGAGFHHIRMVNNINMVFNGLKGNIHDGTVLALWLAGPHDNSNWKILPF